MLRGALRSIGGSCLVGLLLLVGLEGDADAGCLRRCKPAISRCAAATGRTRVRCKKQMVRLCHRSGAFACDAAYPPPTTTTTLPPVCDPTHPVYCPDTGSGSFCCSANFPSCATNQRACCAAGFSIYCPGTGSGPFCCSASSPICGSDGRCHRTTTTTMPCPGLCVTSRDCCLGFSCVSFTCVFGQQCRQLGQTCNGLLDTCCSGQCCGGLCVDTSSDRYNCGCCDCSCQFDEDCFGSGCVGGP